MTPRKSPPGVCTVDGCTEPRYRTSARCQAHARAYWRAQWRKNGRCRRSESPDAARLAVQVRGLQHTEARLRATNRALRRELDAARAERDVLRQAFTAAQHAVESLRAARQDWQAAPASGAVEVVLTDWAGDRLIRVVGAAAALPLPARDADRRQLIRDAAARGAWIVEVADG